MGVQHQIMKMIENFKGIEKRKSDLIDKPGYFSELLNGEIRTSGALSKRKGYFSLAENKGKLGVASYKGISQSELLVMDANLSKVNILDITFSTSLNTTLFISLLPDETGNLIFYVKDPNQDVETSDTVNLGDGYSITVNQNDLTITEFATALSNLPASLAVSINVTSNTPAAFIEPFGITTISNSSSLTTTYAEVSQVTNGDSSYTPFNNYFNQSTISQPTTTATINNVMYFGNGYDEIMKYDGSKIYRAGLPTPTGASASLIEFNVNQNSSVFTGPNNGSSVYYMVVYKYTDAQGNIIRSNPSNPFTPGNDNVHNHHFVKVNLPSLQPGSGFDINNSNLQIEIYRTSVPIAASDRYAHNYYKLTGAGLPSQTVSMSNTSFATIVQGAVNFTSTNVLTSAAISNNSSGGDYFVDYLGNDDTIEITAGEEDITLNDFITPGDYPEGRHNLPPKGRYLTAHQGSLVVTGNLSYPNEVNYSLADFNTVTGEIGTEYFTPSNNVIIDGINGGPITGIRSLQDSLIVFHEDTISALSGDITTPGVQALRKDVVSTHGEIGAVSNAAIHQLESSLVFLSNEGIFTINNTLNYPEELSVAIKPLLVKKELDLSKATSFFSADNDTIGFCIPVIDGDPLIYAFNTQSRAWLKWDNMDMTGGVTRHNRNTYFISKDKNMLRLQKIKNRNDESDYSDHNEAISFDALTAWDSLGDPNIFKKYLRMKVFITDTNLNFETANFKLDMYMRRNFSSLDLGPIELESGYLGGWGVNEWGNFQWGDVGLEGIRTKMFGKARSMALRFKNETINENILISGISFEVASSYNPEIKE